MKRVLMIGLFLLSLWTEKVWSHDMYIKKNPTNENGIEFGVNNATSFVRWRAYVKGQSNNSQGINTGWTNANGWWYYDLSTVTQRVMWRLDGLQNQKVTVTYWVFKSDGTWEYGPQVEVISDTQLPTASFTNLVNNTVYQQSTFNVSVSSSDNLSGVESIRIYVVVPSGYSLSGWQPSGIANQFYLEFSATSVSYNFTAPAEGLYTFTLWVKDKAGNIAYEPGGQITVGVDLPTPPPEQKYSCNTSTYTCSQSSSGLYSSLSDCQTNCVMPPTPRYSCDSLSGTCSQSTLGLYSTLSDCQSSCQAPPPVDDYKYAEHFIYPMSCSKIYRLEPDSQIPVGGCFDYQPFGSLFAYADKIHLGADLNLKGVNDLGAPLYAIANAQIYNFGWTSGWGNYLILQITAKSGKSFTLPNGQTVTQIYALYGHLNEIKIIKDDGSIITQSQIVKKATYVKSGWQVGTVGDGNGNYSPHLHFEIRINGYDQLGPGYWPATDFVTYLKYWVDPIEFIEANMADSAQKPLTIFVSGYQLDTNGATHVELDTSLWQRQGRATDGTPLAAVGNDNYFWLLSTAKDNAAAFHFYLPVGGAYSLYAVIPRYYATAKNVRYRIWHNRQSVANPFEVLVDQTNDNANKLVYLGTYDYFTNWEYSVDVFSKTSDNPAKTVAFDTLVLVYEGDFGTGGGTIPPPPTDNCGNGVCDSGEDANSCPADCTITPPPPPPGVMPTINSSGQLQFEYQGTYSYPKLYCYGANLESNNPILSAGLKDKTLEVSSSALVYCNVQFEDGKWLADWQGMLSGQKLLVNNQEITYTEDNGMGGKNLVFNLVVNITLPPPPPNTCGNGICDNGENLTSCPADCTITPPPPPPPGHGDTTEKDDGNGSKSVGGCQLLPATATSSDIMAYWLVIFSPLLLPLIRRLRYS
jgi:hypothetical protein